MARSNQSEEIDNATYYDRFAKTYEDRRHEGYHLMIDDLEAEVVLPSARDREVLEVGCGTGLILQRVHPVAPLNLQPGPSPRVDPGIGGPRPLASFVMRSGRLALGLRPLPSSPLAPRSLAPRSPAAARQLGAWDLLRLATI